MTVKQLDALKIMVNSLEYNASTITVEQYIHLYNILEPILDEMTGIDNFEGIDTSEI